MKVLYVVGKGRSGSTLLDTVLGELDGFFAAGEVFYLWEMGVHHAYLCGCGRPVPQCELWSRVLRLALTETPDKRYEIEPSRVLGWYRDIFQWRKMPKLLRLPAARPSGWESLDAYADIMSRVYSAIATVTGARVIIDSSKWPTDPVLLGLVSGVEAYCLHLVRDPRAVVHSWKRRKALPERGATAMMPRYSSAYSAVSWIARNALVERVRRRLPSDRYLLVRYEDFVTEPRKWVETIAGFVGEPAGPSSLLEPLDRGRILVGPNHTVAGNPARFTTGTLELREDADWKRQLGPVDRGLSTMISLPLLRRYGYHASRAFDQGGGA